MEPEEHQPGSFMGGAKGAVTTDNMKHQQLSPTFISAIDQALATVIPAAWQ
jgi:hypothetical protein